MGGATEGPHTNIAYAPSLNMGTGGAISSSCLDQISSARVGPGAIYPMIPRDVVTRNDGPG